MSQAIKAVIFDWDGTLMDSTSFIAACFKQAAVSLDLPPPPEKAVVELIGISLEGVIEGIYPSIESGLRHRFARVFRAYFFSDDAVRPSLYPGAISLLESLQARGFHLAIATGKGRRGLDHDLERTDLAPLFTCTKTAEETRPKPNPQMLHEIVDELGLKAGDAIMVGDTCYDIEMAHHAGVQSVGVTYGAHAREDLLASEPALVVDSLPELGVCLMENRLNMKGTTT